jgi:hypothetical protein
MNGKVQTVSFDFGLFCFGSMPYSRRSSRSKHTITVPEDADKENVVGSSSQNTVNATVAFSDEKSLALRTPVSRARIRTYRTQHSRPNVMESFKSLASFLSPSIPSPWTISPRVSRISRITANTPSKKSNRKTQEKPPLKESTRRRSARLQKKDPLDYVSLAKHGQRTLQNDSDEANEHKQGESVPVEEIEVPPTITTSTQTSTTRSLNRLPEEVEDLIAPFLTLLSLNQMSSVSTLWRDIAR